MSRSGLMVRECLTSIQVLGSNPSWILDVFRGFISHSLNKNILFLKLITSCETLYSGETTIAKKISSKHKFVFALNISDSFDGSIISTCRYFNFSRI